VGCDPGSTALDEPVAELVIAGMQVTQVFSVRLAILTLAGRSFCCSVSWRWLMVS